MNYHPRGPSTRRRDTADARWWCFFLFFYLKKKLMYITHPLLPLNTVQPRTLRPSGDVDHNHHHYVLLRGVHRRGQRRHCQGPTTDAGPGIFIISFSCFFLLFTLNINTINTPTRQSANWPTGWWERLHQDRARASHLFNACRRRAAVIKACQVRFFFFSLPSFFTSSLSPQTATHQPTHKPCRSPWRPVSLTPPRSVHPIRAINICRVTSRTLLFGTRCVVRCVSVSLSLSFFFKKKK